MYYYEKKLRDTLDAENGPTLRQLGKALEVPAVTLHDWLHLGKKPHLKNLIKLAEYFKIPLPAMLVDIETNSNLLERVIILATTLTPDQQQQIVNQIEPMIPTDVDVPWQYSSHPSSHGQ